MPLDESDRALVERVKAGDVRAFGTLHRRYYAKIYRLAYLKTGNTEEAQDAASETFCRALDSLRKQADKPFEFRRCDSLYPWLHRIAHNYLVDRARAKPAGGIVSLDATTSDEVSTFLEQLPDEGPSPQELVERHEVQALVRRAIGQLPADQATAVQYRFLADLSIKEIARALNRSEGAVKSLLHRALVTLRREMQKQLAEAPAAVPQTRIHTPSQRTEGDVQNVIRLHQTDPR
jgi:RNA polymerase sigma-70 factor (ECF subfamily)